ncbi:MAG: hypothetical protein ACI8RD_009249 [Bacillariaceae sp.]|jgi:hypothetical protein
MDDSGGDSSDDDDQFLSEDEEDQGYSQPYYDSPPIDLLDYPDGFSVNHIVIDLDADYEATTKTKTDNTNTADDCCRKPIKGIKRLYSIETDTNQRDFSAPVGLYGLFLSSYGFDPVNRVAIELMSKFCDLNTEGRDSESNLDGKDTKDGERYDGFACFNYGGTSLSVMVNKTHSDQIVILRQLYRKGLLQKALQLFQDGSKSTKGSKEDDAIKSIQEFIDKK